MWEAPSGSFTVDKSKTEIFQPIGGWNDPVDVKIPWQVEAPAYQSNPKLKNLYGIELAKNDNPLDAAIRIFPDDDAKAMWISDHWVNDPITIAAKDAYLKSLEQVPPLDRTQLAAKVLAISEERVLNSFGRMVHTAEPKDRIAALKLYSDILGYTGKVEIDNSVKNITNNELTIKLVKPEASKNVKVIDHTPNVKSEIATEILPSPISLKLVGGVSR
jgi:hypothetical protein